MTKKGFENLGFEEGDTSLDQQSSALVRYEEAERYSAGTQILDLSQFSFILSEYLKKDISSKLLSVGDSGEIVRVVSEGVAKTFQVWNEDRIDSDPRVRARAEEYGFEETILPATVLAVEKITENAVSFRKVLQDSLPEYVKETSLLGFLKGIIDETSLRSAKHAYDHMAKVSTQKMAEYDTMTGLAKFAAIKPIVMQWIKEGRSVAYVNLDFNKMKVANTAFGHAFVDKLLQMSATILDKNLRQHEDQTFRRSDKADEFGAVAIVQNIETVNLIAEKLYKALGKINIPTTMSREDYSLMLENRKSLTEKLQDFGLNETEMEALDLINAFLEVNKISTINEEASRSSWDALPAAKRFLDMEKDARVVEPVFGWAVSASFYDPNEKSFSNLSPDEVLLKLEKQSEIGISKQKLNRGKEVYAIVNAEGKISFFDKERKELNLS